MQKTGISGTTTYVGGLYEIYPSGGVAQDVGDLGRGVACQGSATGTGYLMYSEEDFHTRFANPSAHGQNADHFICVIYRNGTWQYDSNYEYATFTPRPTDVLVAAVDYTNDTVSSLEGVNSSYQGIKKGYADGDVTYSANMWNNTYNTNGEFQVFGSTITPHAGSDVRKTYTFGGQSVAVYKDGTLSYLHSDHLNSASLATDASGGKVASSDIRYTPFGETRANAPGNNLPTDRRYTGQREVADLGLYDYSARYYDPYIGRFIQADTVIPNPGNSQDLNRYTYVNNNPLIYVDPSGHSAILIGVGIVLIATGVGAIANYGHQVHRNMQQGMDFWNAAYHENINWRRTANTALTVGYGTALVLTAGPVIINAAGQATVGTGLLLANAAPNVGATLAPATLGAGYALINSGDAVIQTSEQLSTMLWTPMDFGNTPPVATPAPSTEPYPIPEGGYKLGRHHDPSRSWASIDQGSRGGETTLIDGSFDVNEDLALINAGQATVLEGRRFGVNGRIYGHHGYNTGPGIFPVKDSPGTITITNRLWQILKDLKMGNLRGIQGRLNGGIVTQEQIDFLRSLLP